jgi:three-Cys-motif partner protein
LKEFELPAPADDGRDILEVGEWARDKHHFLRRYLHAFCVAMKNKRWSGLHYIDLFAGPGILRLQDSGKLLWGSPLIAAQVPGFTALHLCEKKPKLFDALTSRLESTRSSARIITHLYHADANRIAPTLIQKIPPKALCLAFLDPYGLHLEFKTLTVLAQRRVDLIIFFPDHLDAIRNLRYVYHDQPNSNLDRYLGEGVDWRAAIKRAPQSKWAETLRKLYEVNIRKLGYKEFEHARICGKSGPLYQLIYCSHHPAGSKIWRGIASTQPGGQRTLDFGD